MTDLPGYSLTIGELATRTGVSVRALRYYEQHGLVPAQRTGTGHRRFAEGAVESVRRVRMFLDAGLPLAVVGQVVRCFEDDGSTLNACVAEYLEEHMDTVSGRMAELGQQAANIRQLQSLVAG